MSKLSQIQNLPEQTRVKILWVLTGIIAVGLAAIWVYSTAQQVRHVGELDLIHTPPPPAGGSVASENHYVSVEWVERKNGELLVYFKSNNTTPEIMNFSKADQITLSNGTDTWKAKTVTSRQGNPFPSKILSNTQNFGIAKFDDPKGDKVTIKFDNLYFENKTDIIFYESNPLDLNKLTKQTN